MQSLLAPHDGSTCSSLPSCHPCEAVFPNLHLSGCCKTTTPSRHCKPEKPWAPAPWHPQGHIYDMNQLFQWIYLSYVHSSILEVALESFLSSGGELICIYFPWSIVSLHTTSESLQWELEPPHNLGKRRKGHLRTTTHTRITYIDTYKRHGLLVTLIVAVLTTGH